MLSLAADPEDLEAPISGGTSGPLKAASERAGWSYFGEESTMVRPTFVIGSFDSTLASRTGSSACAAVASRRCPDRASTYFPMD